MRGSSVSVFPHLSPPVTTPKTDALYVLTVCRRSFCLFHCVFFFSFFFFYPSVVFFFYTPPSTSVFYSGGCLAARKQQRSPSRALVFDDLHYISLLQWRYSGLTCCVCINCGANDSNKREEQPYGDGNMKVRTIVGDASHQEGAQCSLNTGTAEGSCH